MTKKLPEEVKKSRRPISRACQFCHTKHLQCDAARPCNNCVKRGVAESCRNVERKKNAKTNGKIEKPSSDSAKPSKKRGRKPKAPQFEHNVPQRGLVADSGLHDLIVAAPANTNLTPDMGFVNYTGASQSIKNARNSTLSDIRSNNSPSNVQAHLQSQGHNSLRPEQHMFYNQSPATSLSSHGQTPASSVAGSVIMQNSPDQHATTHSHHSLNETASFAEMEQSDSSSSSQEPEIKVRSNLISYHADTLNDVMNKDDLNFMLNAYNQSLQESKTRFDSTLVNDEYVQLTNLLTTNPPSPSDFFDFEINSRSYIQLGDTDPVGGNKQDKNFIHINTSAIANTPDHINNYIQDEEDYTAPLVLRHVIKTPDDIYLTNIVKSYQYPNAYHALIRYLKQRFKRDHLLLIARYMAAYRPSFISATKSLYENDLIFTEKSFQRSLLEYENLISMCATPTIIWRRTGEITALTTEFSALTGYTRSDLLSKRTFIVELMDDESALRYFKLFSDIAFGDLNATILTDCVIKKAGPEAQEMRCASVWTIKRDVFDIPMLIVGQFLPIL